MKVTTADLDAMREVIAPLDTEEMRQRYRDRKFPRADAVKDLDTRYRFDLFYGARAYSVVDGDYTDAHFATALRTIVPAL